MSRQLTLFAVSVAAAVGAFALAQAPKSKEQCVAMAKKLDGFLLQRSRFQKTIYQGQEQLNVWEEANRAALVNAAKDGFEFFAGKYLDVLKNRSEFAETGLQRINAQRDNLARAGYNMAAYEAKLNRFKTIGTVADNVAKANDWQTLMKDGVSSLIAQLSSSNEEMKAMMDEVSKALEPAQPYGKVPEHLKQALQQMQSGQQAKAAQSLADAVALALDNARLYEYINDERSRLQASIRFNRDGITLLGMNQRVLVINAPALRLLALPGEPEEWLNRSTEDLIRALRRSSPAVVKAMLSEMRRIHRGDEPPGEGAPRDHRAGGQAAACG